MCSHIYVQVSVISRKFGGPARTKLQPCTVSKQPAEQRREEAFPCRPQRHKTAPTPCPDLPFLPLQQGRSSAAVHRAGAASQEQSLGSMAKPCHEGPKGTRGVCVTAQVLSAASELLPLVLGYTCMAFTSFI